MADAPDPNAPTTDSPPVIGSDVPVPVPDVISPQPASIPTLEEQLATERAERLRLEGQIQALERQPRPAAASVAEAPPPKITREAVEAAYQAGQITEPQRIEALTDLRFEEKRQQWERERREQDSLEFANDRMTELISAHPDLTNPQSELLGRVKAELKSMRRLQPHLDDRDLRVQVLAAERVLGAAASKGTPTMPDPHDFNRRRIPVGASGVSTAVSPAPLKAKPKGEAIWDRLSSDAQGFFLKMHNGNIAEVHKTLEYADEAKLASKGHLVR